MNNNRGVSLISLIITIVVIISLAGMVVFNGFGATESAEFARFTQEFSDYQEIISQEYNSRKADSALNGRKKKDTEIYKEIAGATASGDIGDLLNDKILSENLRGTKYYEIQDIRKFYEEQTGIYLTDNGEVFAMPGYKYHMNGEERYYVNSSKYYKLAEGSNQGDGGGPEISIATISFEQSDYALLKGKSQSMYPTVVIQSGDEILEPNSGLRLLWSSSNPLVMSVNNGNISAIGDGTAILTCAVEGNSQLVASCNVHISDGSEVYAEGDNLSDIKFREIPSSYLLEVGIRYYGRHHEVIRDDSVKDVEPRYIISDDSGDVGIGVGACTAVYYRFKDSFNNYSNYYLIDVEQLCFIKDTLISTPEGLRKIQDIKVGDMVYSKNMEENKVEVKEVLQTFANEVDYNTAKVTIGGEEIECTTGHEIYTVNRGWVKAAYLQKGDILLSKYGAQDAITNIELIEKAGKLDVYNFEVQDNHNYFVGNNEKLVHNPPEAICSISGQILQSEVLMID